MEDKRIIDILLRFGLDNERAKAARAELERIGKEFSNLQEISERTKKQYAELMEQGINAEGLVGTIDDVEKQMAALGDEARKVKKELDDALDPSAKQEAYIQNLNRARESAEKLAQIGSRLTVIGAAMTAPFVLAAKKYVDVGGTLENTSSRWISSMRRIEEAETRVGRVTTDTINPALEKAAELAESIATAFEKNPAVLQSILGIGAGITAAGALVTGGSQIAGSIATLKAIEAGGGAAGAIAGAVPQIAAVVAAVIAAGVVVSAANELSKKIGLANAIDNAQADIRKTGRYYPGVIRGPEQLAAAGGSTPNAFPSNQSDRLSAFAAYQQAVKAREEFEKQSEKARTGIVQEQGQQRVEMERDYDQQRTRALTDFARSEQDAETDYYSQRTEAAASYSIEVQRAEANHQRQMLQMQQEHNDRVRGLVDERDALGLVREQRDYQRQRSTGEQSYRVEAARRSQDFARQLAQMDANFSAQRERRARDFELRLADMDAQHIAEMAKFDEQSRKRLDQFDEQNKKELEQLRKNETERSKILNAVASTQMTIAEAELKVFQDKTIAAYNAWLAKIGANQTANPNYYVYGTGTGTGTGNGSNSNGGITSISGGGGFQQNANGGYPVGRFTGINERGQEFILSNPTTRAMERMVGGKLTQQNVMAAGAKSLTLNINTGGLSERRVLAMLDDSAEGILREIRGAFGAA